MTLTAPAAHPGQTVRVAVVHHAARVTRDTQRPDTLYVDPDGTTWFTPDGIGRIWPCHDEEQTQPMDEDAALDELGFERVVHLDAAPTD